MFDDNRRKYPRANYPCQLTIWLVDGQNQTMLANTSNIGLGGLCVYLNDDLEVNTRVEIQLTFVNTTTPFKCRGVVVHCKQENEKFHKIGIQFEPLSELKYAFLEGKVAELLELEKKGKS